MKYHYYILTDKKRLSYSHTQSDKQGTNDLVTVYFQKANDANDIIAKSTRKLWLVCEELINYEGEDGIIIDNRIKSEYR